LPYARGDTPKVSGKEGRKKQIRELQSALRAAKEISLEALAAQISDIGFKCLGCGECCCGQDNSVVVFPFEISRILTATGLEWLDVVSPPNVGEWDRDGCFHTLEWRLNKENESCRFYQNSLCAIYRDRPILCSTYPFYLDRGELMCSECRGLGGEIEPCEARKMTERLIRRYVTEMQEAIALLEGYRDFERGDANKSGVCIVHDSEGEHRIVDV
jgi:Fe-S-cluster containining protein